MAFSQSDNEDDYRYIRIVGYADHRKQTARNVTPHCIPVILENDHDQNLNDTLTLGENDSLFKVNAKGLTYIKLKIYHEDLKVEVHPIIFERHGTNIYIQLRSEGQLYRYLFMGSGVRYSFTPVKDVIHINRDFSHEKEQKISDFLVENQILAACTIYSRFGLIDRGSPSSNFFRLHLGHPMDSIGNIIENFPSVHEVNPLLCIECHRRGCNPCWFLRNMFIDFTDNVSEDQAIEILEEMGFIDIEKQPDRKFGSTIQTNLYRFSVAKFDGYSFLKKLDLLWERNDIISITNLMYCPYRNLSGY